MYIATVPYLHIPDEQIQKLPTLSSSKQMVHMQMYIAAAIPVEVYSLNPALHNTIYIMQLVADLLFSFFYLQGLYIIRSHNV